MLAYPGATAFVQMSNPVASTVTYPLAHTSSSSTQATATAAALVVGGAMAAYDLGSVTQASSTGVVSNATYTPWYS